MGNLMPQLERLFVIKRRDVEVECDFTASETLVIARLDLTITLGRLLGLAIVYGIRALREFLKLQKKFPICLKVPFRRFVRWWT